MPGLIGQPPGAAAKRKPRFPLYSENEENTYPNEFYATQDEIENIYENLKAEVLSGVIPSASPFAINVGGQTGAGKSIFCRYMKSFINDNNVIIIDIDALRELHPRYKLIVEGGKEECIPLEVFIQELRERLALDLIKGEYSFINHITMRDNRICPQLSRQRENGYTVMVYVLSCNALDSRLGIFERFLREVAEFGHGRLNLRARHDEDYSRLTETLTRIEAENNVDDLRIYNRERELLYRKVNGITTSDGILGKSRQLTAATALECSRKIPWSDNRRRQYQNRCMNIIAELGALCAQGFFSKEDYAGMRRDLQELAREAETRQ